MWDKAITSELKLTGTNVYVHKPSKKMDAKLDKPKARYPSKTLNAKSLLKFVYEKALPTIGVKDMYTKEYYNNVKQPTVYVFLDTEKSKNEAGYKYVTTRLSKLVAKYPGQFVYALVNRKDDETDFREYEFPSHLHSKKGDVTVGLKVQDTVYTMLKPFTAENLVEFIEEYKKDTLVGRPAIVVSRFYSISMCPRNKNRLF